MANVKGTAINGRLQYVLRHHGPQALSDVLGSLGGKTAGHDLRHGALKSNWYPMSLFIALTQAIDRICGKGDGALYRQVAGQTAEDDLSTVYKVFFKFAKPSFIISKAASLWRQYYDTGQLHVTSQPGFCELELIDFGEPSFVHCESVIGWAMRSIELTGAKNVKGEHVSCRDKGEKRCVLRVTWDAH